MPKVDINQKNCVSRQKFSEI